jgi:GTPase
MSANQPCLIELSAGVWPLSLMWLAQPATGLYSEGEWAGVPFTLVDTGGIELTDGRHTLPLSEDSEQFLPLIRQQASMAIQDADVIVQVVDGQTGLTAADREVADISAAVRNRSLSPPTSWNPPGCMKPSMNSTSWPGRSVCHFRLHGTGTGDLLDAIVAAIPPFEEEEEDESIRIAILGRPNVGKSSLVNKLLGEERVIVSPIAGTTRDAIDTPLVWEGSTVYPD